jgi:hypothetical protein
VNPKSGRNSISRRAVAAGALGLLLVVVATHLFSLGPVTPPSWTVREATTPPSPRKRTLAPGTYAVGDSITGENGAPVEIRAGETSELRVSVKRGG